MSFDFLAGAIACSMGVMAFLLGAFVIIDAIDDYYNSQEYFDMPPTG